MSRGMVYVMIYRNIPVPTVNVRGVVHLMLRGMQSWGPSTSSYESTCTETPGSVPCWYPNPKVEYGVRDDIPEYTGSYRKREGGGAPKFARHAILGS